MNCDELLRRLSEYGDGALGKGLCREVERHLEECSPCAELERDLEALARLCRECDRPRLPPDLRRRLEAKLRGEPPPP